MKRILLYILFALTITVPCYAQNRVSVAEFYFLVSANKIPGAAAVHKFGLNPVINTTDGFEDIWNGGGVYTGFNCIGFRL